MNSLKDETTTSHTLIGWTVVNISYFMCQNNVEAKKLKQALVWSLNY